MLSIINAAAAVATIVAAVLIASNHSAKIMLTGFVVFVGASLLWIVSGVVDAKMSLVIQNVVLLLVNIFGIWRWWPKAS